MTEIDIDEWARVPEYFVSECAAVRTKDDEIRFYYNTVEHSPEEQTRRVPVIKLIMPLATLRAVAVAVMDLIGPNHH